MRQVIPAGGAASVAIAWDNSTLVVPAGTVLDIPPGSALESAYGLANLTALTGSALATDQSGAGGPATANG